MASRPAWCTAIVGALSTPNVQIGDFYLRPEMGFLIGNLIAFVASPKGRFKLTLLRIEKAAAGCYDFVFQQDRELPFRPGQYLDCTLRVQDPDDRGQSTSIHCRFGADGKGDAARGEIL